MTQRRKDSILLALFTLILLALIIGICASLSACNSNTVKVKNVIDDTDTLYWNTWGEEDYTVLDFTSIYFIDTTNMVLCYDNFDQFDIDRVYEETPDNVTEDFTLKLHISKDNMVELINRIFQYMDERNNWDNRMYLQSMFGIVEVKGEYWVTYKGKQ